MASRYRTKVEVLRDVLLSAQPDSSKTRIQRLANLNPASLENYLALCVGTGLVEPLGGRFRRTSSGDEAISAIDRVMRRAEELGFAVQQLGTCLGADEVRVSESISGLRFASTEAWDALARSAARSEGFHRSLLGTTAPSENGRSSGSKPGPPVSALPSDGPPIPAALPMPFPRASRRF